MPPPVVLSEEVPVPYNEQAVDGGDRGVDPLDEVVEYLSAHVLGLGCGGRPFDIWEVRVWLEGGTHRGQCTGHRGQA